MNNNVIKLGDTRPVITADILTRIGDAKSSERIPILNEVIALLSIALAAEPQPVPGFDDANDPKVEPTVIYYETAAMADLRQLITSTSNFTNAEFDIFKLILARLERLHGFELKGPEL